MRRLPFLFAFLLLTGCATMINGTSQSVRIESEPANATVEVNSNPYGETPTAVELSRDRTHVVEIRLDGYEPHEITLQKGTSGWVAGNIVFGGIPGFIIDAATGGMYKLTPKVVNARLDGKTASVADEDALVVAVTLEPKDEWEKVGTLTPKD